LAVCSAAVALRAKRDELRAKHNLSFRELYRSLDLPGAHPLKDAHSNLDEAVRAAYEMDQTADTLLGCLTSTYGSARGLAGKRCRDFADAFKEAFDHRAKGSVHCAVTALPVDLPDEPFRPRSSRGGRRARRPVAFPVALVSD
jgi:hypothetical protein